MTVPIRVRRGKEVCYKGIKSVTSRTSALLHHFVVMVRNRGNT